MYAINGVFFQQHQTFGTNHSSWGEAVALVHEGLCYFTFSGLIGPDPESDSSERVMGRTQDSFGEATLTQIHFIPNQSLQFVKEYDRMPYKIQYALRKQSDGTWAGTYTGEMTGTGVVRMLLTDLPEDFLDPQVALHLSGQSSLHKWPKGIEP